MPNGAAMPRKKRPSKVRPKTPSRVKKRTTKKKGPKGHHHPELIGLGLVAFGLFAAAVLWAGWDGGFAGRWLEDGVEASLGAAASSPSSRSSSGSPSSPSA